MKEKMTTVLLPRGRKQEENFVIVSVNGRSWKIMRGVEVRVPVCVAEVLENAAMMAEVAADLTVYTGGDCLLTDDKAPVEVLGMRVLDELIAGELDYYRENFSLQEILGMLG